ncbi:MAG: acyltransferase family protein [Promethearchaeota archaeon]
MAKKRLKSIDTLRGVSICWMIFTHCLSWWIIDEDRWIALILWGILDFLGSTAFIFISGVSTALYYNSRKKRAEINDEYNDNMIRNEYLFRAVFLLLLAICYNIVPAVALGNPADLWKWFVLLAIAISLFLAWPLLKVSKWIRIIICIISWIFYLILLIHLYPYAGQSNIQGIIFHIFYNSMDLDPILGFFPFFLLGTIFGDIIYEINKIDNHLNRKMKLKKNLIFPILVCSPVLIFSGVFFELNLTVNYSHGFREPFPDFLLRGSFPWMMYSLGVFLLLFCCLIVIEELEIFKNNEHKFFFYFSYYSLTVYLIHNLLYFLFFKQLNILIIWPALFGTLFIIWVILGIVYRRFGEILSIKFQLGRLSRGIAQKIEERNKT